jgi:putative membrane protein
MSRMLLHWIVTALAVWITSRLVAGFSVSGATAALIAAVVIGLVNATLGLFLKVVTFPLTLLTLGLFWFVINAVMIERHRYLCRGFIFPALPRHFGVELCLVWSICC